MPAQPVATLPPYSLPPHRFSFRALAAYAARAPIGGAREIALACLMAGHLALGARVAVTLPRQTRTRRLAAVRAWFAAVSLPAALRLPIGRFTDALAVDPAALAPALEAVLAAARRHLDAASAGELERVIRTLRSAEPHPPEGAPLTAAPARRIFES